MQKILLGLDVDTTKFRAAVAKATQILTEVPDTHVMREMIRSVSGTWEIGVLTYTNPYVRDACFAAAQASEWKVKLETLAANMDGYVELAFPEITMERVVGTPMLVISDATNYSTVACVLYNYILAAGTFPQLRGVGEVNETETD